MSEASSQALYLGVSIRFRIIRIKWRNCSPLIWEHRSPPSIKRSADRLAWL